MLLFPDRNTFFVLSGLLPAGIASETIRETLQFQIVLYLVLSTSPGSGFDDALWSHGRGFWVSQAIYVAAKLGIADLLRGPGSASAWREWLL
jgi:hypothetical protein